MRQWKILIAPISLVVVILMLFILNARQKVSLSTRSRLEAIPATAKKLSPAEDFYSPKLHSSEWQKPVPLPAPVNTAGAEDSPFITPDGKTLYIFFTPDPGIPAEKQLFDGVTGIWRSQKTETGWSEPERVWLAKRNELALDGCEFVLNDIMWFCSARRGNLRSIDLYTAEYRDGSWQKIKNAGRELNLDYLVGEMHISSDGQEMYYHSTRTGGAGGMDIWMIRKLNGGWQAPENVSVVNSIGDEGWPFVSEDGSELWFTRTYRGSPSIWRSKKTGDVWQKPELILSQFAGEPTLDREGNLYFTHHFYKDGKMIEADIYMAKKKLRK